MNKKFSLIFIFICALIFVFGCNDPANLVNQHELKLPPGKGAFSLSIDGARTILPNTTITSFQVYTLEFTGTETLNIDRTNANLSTPISLQVGTYNLNVTAYMDTAKAKPAAVGTLTGIVITAGQVTNRTIPLTAFGMTAGKGAFSWNIDFPDELIEVKMKITPAGGLAETSEQTLYFKGGSSQVNKIDSVQLNSGMYRVLFTLIKNENTQTVIWRDVVHVYQNMTSVFNYTFTEAHFNNIRYTVTFVYNDGTTGDSPLDRFHGKTVNAPTSPSRTGYIFDDWYTDNGSFQNKYVFSTVLTGDLKLYAKWNPISYTVVYDKGEPGATGTTADSSHTYDEYKPLTANGYYYTNYTFAGWAETKGGDVEFRDGHRVINLTSKNDTTVMLYARWGTQPYYIEYNKNSNEAEGTMTRSMFFFGIKEKLEENSFIRTGYTFAGWAMTSDGPMKFTDKEAVLDLVDTVDASVTLYAKWTVHKLAISYNNGGGTGTAPTSPTSADYGTNVTMPDNTYEYTGHTFAGWEVSGTGFIEGTYNEKVIVAVKDLSTAIKTGNASITLTAKWTANTLFITYDSDGGSGSAPTEPASAAYGTSVIMPTNTFTRTGYTFAGWVVSGTGSIAGTYVAGAKVAVSALSTAIASGNANITLTASWTVNTLTISYANGGGTGYAPSSPISETYGNNVTMPPNPYTRDGYTFAGWEVSGTGSTYAAGADVAVSALSTAIANGNASITLTAKWNINQYTVTYYPDGGTPVPTGPVTVNYGNTVNQPPAMTKVGYGYYRWYTDSAKTVPAVFPITVTGNVSLYAKWMYVTEEMVWVEGGTFQMGKNLGTADGSDSIPLRDVTLTGFYMSKYPVTQELYYTVMGNNPSRFYSNPAEGENQWKRPVENISWYNAIVFCNKLSIAEGLTPAYSISGSTDTSVWGTVPTTSNDSTWDAVVIGIDSNGYRLPTEAQWEYAAKGGNQQAPGWVGYTYSGSDTVDDVAWYASNSDNKTHEVGIKLSNKLGIYDMSGNVDEWCWDWHWGYWFLTQTDPTGEDSGSHRVLRGGGRYNSAEYTRSASRYYDSPGSRGHDSGFRLVRP